MLARRRSMSVRHGIARRSSFVIVEEFSVPVGNVSLGARLKVMDGKSGKSTLCGLFPRELTYS
jgi:hypothetical protein